MAIKDKYLQFNGIDGYVDAGRDFAGYKIKQAITLEAWIYIDSMSSATTGIISKVGGSAGVNSGYALQVSSDGRLVFALYGQTGAIVNVSSTGTLSAGAWYHVAATYDGTTAKIYINTNDDKSVAAALPGVDISYDNEANLLIGKGPGTNAYFKGRICEVRIWKAALTKADLNANQLAAINASYPDIAARWPFDEGSTLSANDAYNGLLAQLRPSVKPGPIAQSATIPTPPTISRPTGFIDTSGVLTAALDKLNRKSVMDLLKQLKDQVKSQSTTIKNQATTIGQHDQKLTTLEGEIDGIETTVQGHTTTIQGHTTTIQGHTTTIQGHTTTIGQHGQKLTTLEGEIDGIETTVQGHTTTIQGHTTGINANKQDIQQLRTDLDNHVNNHNTLIKPTIDAAIKDLLTQDKFAEVEDNLKKLQLQLEVVRTAALDLDENELAEVTTTIGKALQDPSLGSLILNASINVQGTAIKFGTLLDKLTKRLDVKKTEFKYAADDSDITQSVFTMGDDSIVTFNATRTVDASNANVIIYTFNTSNLHGGVPGSFVLTFKKISTTDTVDNVAFAFVEYQPISHSNVFYDLTLN